MVLIYIKLGSATEFHDERLNFHLVAGKPSGILDYTNINEHITTGLIAEEIIQISEAEYYSLIPPPPEEPIVVVPSELINITNYLPPCPLDATVLFAHYAGTWYKILWSTVKSCVGGFSSLRFRVGDSTNDLDVLPDVGENKFVHPSLVGKTHSQLMVTINGAELHPRSTYEDRGDQNDFDWYVLHEDLVPDDTPGMFQRNPAVPFGDKEIVIIRGI